MAGEKALLKLKSAVVDDSSQEDEEEEDKGNDLSLSLEKLNLGPTKKLLVLSLGGLLLHRVHLKDKDNTPKRRRPDAVFGNFLVFKRPFSHEFLEFCFKRFEVGIWSSARESNVEAVLNAISKGLAGRFLFVWDQKECTDSGFKSLENNKKPIFLKDMKKLWETKISNLPWRCRQCSSSHTLLIDNEPYKALLNPPNSAIFPHKYNADNVNDNVLGPKGELRRFLEGLAKAHDVPSYVKDHPFGQPAITSSHPDWYYYSKVIGGILNISQELDDE